MGTTPEIIRGWLERVDKQKYSHMLVVCDTAKPISHKEYPVYVSRQENVLEVLVACDSVSSTQRVVGIYNYTLNLNMQISESMAWFL